MSRERISIIGAGSWGTTLGVILAHNNIEVFLHSVFDEHNRQMQRERQNRQFLKGVRFPPGLVVVSSLKEVLESKNIIIAVPVKFLRRVMRKLGKNYFKDKTFISVSKGLEISSFKRPSQIIKEEIRGQRIDIAVLSGPTIAHEVIKGIPTACVVASSDIRKARELQHLLSTPHFRVYAHTDVVGVELGGALKNIIAIACGMADGLGLGTNTKAALLTRGLVEIARLGKTLGARETTFHGISGLGDLVTTCFSSYSRNRFVGEQIGRGKRLKDILQKMNMVAEGVYTVKATYALSRRLGVDMPITREVYLILYRNKSPRKGVSDLMRRPLKVEDTCYRRKR